MSVLEVRNIKKRFGKTDILKGISFSLEEGQVVAIVVYGPCRFFGLFGRGEEFYIPWECIQRIGDDIILIDKPFQRRDPGLERKRRRGR